MFKKKGETRKRWEISRLEGDKVKFRIGNKRAKKAVARAKARALNDVCSELKTPEKNIYKITNV